MSSLLDPLLNVLPPLLAQKDSEHLADALTSLIEVSVELLKMFKQSFLYVCSLWIHGYFATFSVKYIRLITEVVKTIN